MTKEILLSLESVNQLALTDEERESVMSFFDVQDEKKAKMDLVNTEDIERMVHVMPLTSVVREDKEIKLFTRDELQESAPETMDGYWQVPRLVE